MSILGRGKFQTAVVIQTQRKQDVTDSLEKEPGRTTTPDQGLNRYGTWWTQNLSQQMVLNM